LAGGLFGPLCLIAQGKKLGMTERFLEKEMKDIPEIKKYLKNVVLPVDFAVDNEGVRETLSLDEFPSKYRIMDLGDGTIKLFAGEIKKAKCVFMKGTAGFAEDERFAKGTVELLKAVAAHVNVDRDWVPKKKGYSKFDRGGWQINLDSQIRGVNKYIKQGRDGIT